MKKEEHMASRATVAVKIFDILDKLENAVINCDPQTPVIAVNTAQLIEIESFANNIDEFNTDQFLTKLHDLTSAFSNNCRCENVQLPSKIGQSRRENIETTI
jgi:hypothetical protein